MAFLNGAAAVKLWLAAACLAAAHDDHDDDHVAVPGVQHVHPPNFWDARSRIFANYSAHDPPPNMQVGKPLNMQVGIVVQKVQFDILTSTLRLGLWLRLKWLDERLLYDPDDVWGPGNWNASNLAQDYVPIRLRMGDDVNLWVPDIHCVEAADSTVGLSESMAYIHHRASPGAVDEFQPWNVFLSRPGTYEVVCSPDLEDFPFDTPICNLTLQSWSFDVGYMRLSNMTDGFQPIDTMPLSTDYMFKDGEPFNWPDATELIGDLAGTEGSGSSADTSWEAIGSEWSNYRIQLQLVRLPGYHLSHSVMPLTMVLVLGALTFFLPLSSDASGSGERLAFTVTLFLTIIAVMLFTAEKRPAIGKTTWLDQWQSRSLWLSVIPIWETVVVFWLHNMMAITDNKMEKEAFRLSRHHSDRLHRVQAQAHTFTEKIDDFGENLASRVMGAFECIEDHMPHSMRKFFGSPGPTNIDNWFQILYPVIVTITFGRLPFKIINSYGRAFHRQLTGQGQSMGSTGIFAPILCVQFTMFAFALYFIWGRCKHACSSKNEDNVDTESSDEDPSSVDGYIIDDDRHQQGTAHARFAPAQSSRTWGGRVVSVQE